MAQRVYDITKKDCNLFKTYNVLTDCYLDIAKIDGMCLYTLRTTRSGIDTSNFPTSFASSWYTLVKLYDGDTVGDEVFHLYGDVRRGTDTSYDSFVCVGTVMTSSGGGANSFAVGIKKTDDYLEVALRGCETLPNPTRMYFTFDFVA